MAFSGITVVQSSPLGEIFVHPLQLTSNKVVCLCDRSKGLLVLNVDCDEIIAAAQKSPMLIFSYLSLIISVIELVI